MRLGSVSETRDKTRQDRLEDTRFARPPFRTILVHFAKIPQMSSKHHAGNIYSSKQHQLTQASVAPKKKRRRNILAGS